MFVLPHGLWHVLYRASISPFLALDGDVEAEVVVRITGFNAYEAKLVEVRSCTADDLGLADIRGQRVRSLFALPSLMPNSLQPFLPGLS